ncbi:MAG TPA: hypothetical protein EYH14_02805 [Euryarchaeota archaeon]|nr:hypothetical protein [Euryarchaeota archaeon]
MADISYVKGRLEGLFELVALLRDLVHEDIDGSFEMLQKMVDHIYVELGDILDIMGSEVPAAVDKAESIMASKMGRLKSKGVKAKDVLSELMSKKEEG